MSTITFIAVVVALVIVVSYLRKQKAPSLGQGRQPVQSKDTRRCSPQARDPFPELREVVVIDFETTGLDPAKDRVISVAAVAANIQEMIADRGQEVRYFSARFNPERHIPKEASKIHGITDADVKDEKPFRDHASALLEFIGTRTIIAHNAEFDVAFLKAELERCGLTLPEGEVFCTMKHGARMLGRSRISLDALSREFSLGARESSRHDALEDTILTLKIATAMAASEKGLRVHTMDVGNV